MRLPGSRRRFRVVCRTIMIVGISLLKEMEHFGDQFTDHVQKPACFRKVLEATDRTKTKETRIDTFSR